jgi:hypothetical protein
MRHHPGQGQEQYAAHDQAGVSNAPGADGFFRLTANGSATKWRATKKAHEKNNGTVEDQLLRMPHARGASAV